ncbi:MAG: hypothetical protein AAGU10_10360, partial [Methanosarcina mazei]
WNYIEYVRNFYKIERIVKSNWDKKEGKIKYQLVVTVKLRIDSGILYDPYFDRNVEDFALTFGMKIINMSGSSEVAEKSYLAARKAVLRKT